MQGGPVAELLDVTVERPALDQLKVEVGRILEDRLGSGLTRQRASLRQRDDARAAGRVVVADCVRSRQSSARHCQSAVTSARSTGGPVAGVDAGRQSLVVSDAQQQGEKLVAFAGG